jgi:hypothetical protein
VYGIKIGRKRLLSISFVIFFTLLLGATLPGARAQDRFAVGAQLAFDHLPELGETPVGYGFRFTYAAFVPFISFDAELNSFPTHGSGNFGQTQALFGLKAGARVGRWGAFLKARPGFAHFYDGVAQQRLTQRTNFALDIGGGVEYYFIPHVGLRWDLSDVMTHFGSGTLNVGPGGPLGVPLGTRGNFQTTLGIVFTL